MVAEETGPDESLRVERRDDAAVVWFDVPGEKVNTLKQGFEKEFGRVLAELAGIEGLAAVALASAKESGWVAGADVGIFERMGSVEEAMALSRAAQAVMDRIESFRVPVVAAIHGSCFGGGLELALACQGRVAVDSLETLFGQLEVRLGIIPGAGGTQRLPRLVGIEKALELILTGKRVPARQAREMDLVDELVPPQVLVEAALRRSRRLARGEKEPKVNLAGKVRQAVGEGLGDRIRTLLLEDNPAGRRVLFKKARQRTLSRTHGNLPAPLRAIDAVEAGIEEGVGEGLRVESEAFGELVVSSEARRLVELFFARQELKKTPGIDRSAAREVRYTGILGAGLMGSGIAAITAGNAGVPVRLKDVDDQALRHGLKAVRETLSDRVDSGRMHRRDLARAMARVTPTKDFSGFGRADVVIEAVFEDVGLKRDMLAEVQERGHERTIFASNTSSIPISRIADGCADPSRVAGMHYFSPVEKIPLLEVIAGEQTAPWVLATCVALGARQGKTVIVVDDGPGFYTTRILSPYLNEALWMVEEGEKVDRIDRALSRAGFPVGPLKLADEVGLDVGHEISDILHEAFGGRMAPAPALGRLVADGRKGRKSGSGFYRYEKIEGAWERVKGEDPIDDSVYTVLEVEPGERHDEEEIVERCVLQMINEAARCFGEGILRSARDGDVGAVFGLGFPAFRGGPLRQVDVDGAAAVVERLERWRQRHGDRFEPAPVLRRLAEAGSGFHDSTVEPGSTAAG